MLIIKSNMWIWLMITGNLVTTHTALTDCNWTVEVTKPERVPFKLDNNVIAAYPSATTLNDIDSINLQYIRKITKDGLYWLPYCLVLSLKCKDNSVGHLLSQEIAGKMDGPVIKLCEVHRNLLCRVIPSVLVDFSRYTVGGLSCVNKICDPVWMSPLPLYSDDLVLELTISSNILRPSQKIFLHQEGYFNITGSTAEYPLLTVIQEPIKFIPRESPTMVFLVGTDLLAVTSNEFLQSYIIQISSILDISGNDVCTCTDWKPSVVTSTDRIILALKTGVYEIQGSFEKQSNRVTTEHKLGSMCVSSISLPSFVKLWPGLITFKGSCQNMNKFYMAQILHLDDKPLNITNSDTEINSHICRTLLNDIANCWLLDTSSMNSGLALLLLEVQYQNSSISYILVESREGIFSLASVLPLSQVHGYNINHISLAPFASMGICLWGNLVICSSSPTLDVWKTLSNYSAEMLVTAQISRHGHVAVLSNTSKVYIGHITNHHMTDVFGNPAWDILHLIKPDVAPASLSAEFNLVSLFFDNIDILQLLYVNNTDNEVKRYSVPYRELLQYDSYMKIARKNESDCPIVKTWIEVQNRSRFSRLKELWYNAPKMLSTINIHNRGSLLAYSSIIHDLELYQNLYLQNTYEKYHKNYIEGWKTQVNSQKDLHDILLPQDIDQGIDVSLDFYHSENDTEQVGLPDVMYLDLGSTVIIDIFIQITNHTDSDTSAISLITTSSEPDLVTVNDISSELLSINTYQFQISVNDSGTYKSISSPGVSGKAVGIAAQVTSANCQDTMEFFQTTLVLGCPPNKKITFDWQASMIRLQQPDVQQTTVDCYQPDQDMPCFYFDNDFYPHFLLHDLATGQKETYTGNYTLKVVGGSPVGPDNIKQFSKEDISQFNLYDIWLCESGSPCDNIAPDFPHSPHYFFLLQFSNRDVDLSSRCDLTFDFVVHVHGLPLSSLKTGTVIFSVSTILLCCYVLVYWLCHWKNDQMYTKFMHQLHQVKCRSNMIYPKDTANPEKKEIELESTVFSVPHIVYSADTSKMATTRSKEYIADFIPSELTPATSKATGVHKVVNCQKKDHSLPHVSSPNIRVSSYEHQDLHSSSGPMEINEVMDINSSSKAVTCKSVQFSSKKILVDEAVESSIQLQSKDLPQFQFNVESPSADTGIDEDPTNSIFSGNVESQEHMSDVCEQGSSKSSTIMASFEKETLFNSCEEVIVEHHMAFMEEKIGAIGEFQDECSADLIEMKDNFEHSKCEIQSHSANFVGLKYNSVLPNEDTSPINNETHFNKLSMECGTEQSSQKSVISHETESSEGIIHKDSDLCTGISLSHVTKSVQFSDTVETLGDSSSGSKSGKL